MAQSAPTASVVGQGSRKLRGVRLGGWAAAAAAAAVLLAGGGKRRCGVVVVVDRDRVGSSRWEGDEGRGGGPMARKRMRERSERTASPTVATWCKPMPGGLFCCLVVADGVN